MNSKFSVLSLKLVVLTIVYCLLFTSFAACSSSSLAGWADKASRYSARAATIVQGYVNDGTAPNAAGLVTRLNQFSGDSKVLADAFRNGASNTIELAANLTTALETILSVDVDLIPAGEKRTAVMIALAVVDEVLHDIADNLSAQANTFRHHAVFGRFVQQAEKSDAARKLREFAKKPRLRCRDAKTGHFVKMDQCKTHPDTTVIERVKS